VYWGSSLDGIGAANLNGGEPQWNYFYWPSPSESQGPPCGVAVNSEYLYWAAPGGIGRRKLDGERIYPATIVPRLNGPCGLALDQDHVYWGNFDHPPTTPRSGSLGRAGLDGSEPNSAFVTGLERPCDVAVGGDHVFWIERGSLQQESGIGRAGLDGSLPQRPFISLPYPGPSCGLAARGGYLYWGRGGAIARANLDGSEEVDAFIPEAGAVDGIAVQAGHIYWAARWPGGTASIGRANLDGSDTDPNWISGSDLEFGGVAVDERPTPPNLTLPSRWLRFVRSVEYNLRSGAILFGVYVPPQGPLAAPSPPEGQLVVDSPGLSWKVFTSTERLASQGGAYLWQVRVRARKGAKGRRIRSRLRRRGWARVNVHLTYRQDRVYTVGATRRLILRRYRGASAGWVKHPGPPNKRRSRR